MIYTADNRYINLAAQKILEGQIIVYPTDTLYGFGVDATNSNAINTLNKLKKRNSPLSIIVSSMEMLEEYANFDKTYEPFRKMIPFHENIELH